MAATLERQIYEAIRGKCISDASAEQAAALAAELAVEKFTSANIESATCNDCGGDLTICNNCHRDWNI